MPSKAGLVTTAEAWASVEDVAAHLGVARDSVYRWIEGRRLPAHRIGRLWKFKLSEVDDWVRAGGAGDDAPEARRRGKPTPKSSMKTKRSS